MTRFQKHTAYSPQSIGDTLRKTREEYGLQIEAIADVLCIQKKNLEYLENNAFSHIPETLYRELFLKTYSTYLGLSWDQLRAQYHRECNLYSVLPTSKSEVRLRRRVRMSSLWVTPKIIRNAFLTCCISGGFLYIAYLGWNMLQPPQLVIFQPSGEFSMSNTEQVIVAGQTKKEARVTINGQVVVKKQDGTFSQEVALQSGLNLITVTVSKKFSHPQSMIRKVVFKKEDEKYSYKGF